VDALQCTSLLEEGHELSLLVQGGHARSIIAASIAFAFDEYVGHRGSICHLHQVCSVALLHVTAVSLKNGQLTSASCDRIAFPSSIVLSSTAVYFAPLLSSKALAFLQNGQPVQLNMTT